MYTILKYCVAAWIILTGVIYFAEAFPHTQMKFPLDVYLPPGENGGILPPVIMLHGLTNWRKSFKLIAPEIAKNTGRVVYAYDSVNHGENEWTEDMDQNTLVLELDQFMQQYNVSKAILFGHSLGGVTAMYFALQKPEKVEKLILEDISPKIITNKTEDFLISGLKMLKYGITQYSDMDEMDVRRLVIRTIKRLITFEEFEGLDEFLMEWIPITKRDGKIDSMANLDLFIKIAEEQTPEKLAPTLVGEFQGDTLFLCASKSVFDPVKDETVPKHFPHSTFVNFERGNHWIHVPFFTKCVRTVSDFINKESSVQ